MAGVTFGTENSAGFGEAVFACGGLWAALLPELLNLDEILENQEFRRCGVGMGDVDCFSSVLVLREFDLRGVAGASLSDCPPLTVEGVGGWFAAGVGVGESRPGLDNDLGRDAAFFVSLSGEQVLSAVHLRNVPPPILSSDVAGRFGWYSGYG